jgi:hypothetical protein
MYNAYNQNWMAISERTTETDSLKTHPGIPHLSGHPIRH